MSLVYLFPFQSVEKGSTIAVYGVGLVGLDYLRQIKETKYCKVAFVASKDYKSVNAERTYGFELAGPEKFKDSKDIDYIIIATTNEEYQFEMIKILESFGIVKEKIILPSVSLQVRDITYSQHGEDRLICEALKHMGFFRGDKLPSYIDIGAHHPYELSNTALLYQLGCHGINIDANPDLIRNFEQERPNDRNLCFGVGAEEGTFPFYMTEYAGLNTFKKENLEYNEFLTEQNTGIREHFPVKQTMDVPIKKLDTIIKEYSDGKWPEFMSIDIEGMEYETLCAADLTDGPLMIVVEVNYDGDLFIEMMKDKGYFSYLWYRENIIFVRQDMEHLVHNHTER